jgi:hypothetical protein
MTMGKFHFAPQQGHLDCLQKYPDAAIRFCTGIPDYSHLDHATFNWAYSVNGDSVEELPSDMLTPRGTPVCTTKRMPISCMISLLEGLVLVSLILSTKLLLNGFPSVKRPFRLPPMDPNLSLLALPLNKA